MFNLHSKRSVRLHSDLAQEIADSPLFTDNDPEEIDEELSSSPSFG